MADVAPRRHIGYADALNLVTSLCLTYTLCVAGLRIWVRRGNFGVDDTVIWVATVVGLGHFAANYLALEEGLGKPLRSIEAEGDIEILDAASVTSVVTFVISLYLTKCAVLVFLARITKQKQQIIFYRICLVCVALMGIASVLMVTIGCPIRNSFYWALPTNQATCPSQSGRWQAFTALDVITEIALLVLPVHLVWGLQMPLRRKATVITAFYLRLPVLGFSIGRQYYTERLQLSGTDTGPGGALVVIWLENEMSYALASSTLSTLKAFTENFNSNFGLAFTRNAGDASYGMSDVSGGSNSGGLGAKEKKAVVQTVRSADTSRTRSPAPGAVLKGKPTTHAVEVVEDEVGYDRFEREPGRLRSDEVRSYTDVCAAPHHHPHTPPMNGADELEHGWREPSAHGSERRMLPDMVIVRETQYTVHHDDANDQAPMLSQSNAGLGHGRI